jgi:hypothetical protein
MKDLGFAKFKWPERVEVIDALPLTKVGKLDKAPLRERIRKQLASANTPTDEPSMTATIFVPDIPEFLSLVRAAEKVPGCVVRAPEDGYWRVEGKRELRFSRKDLGLGPAIWNSVLSGGFIGRIVEYGRDDMVIAGED